jgi:hypothetical protein
VLAFCLILSGSGGCVADSTTKTYYNNNYNYEQGSSGGRNNQNNRTTTHQRGAGSSAGAGAGAGAGSGGWKEGIVCTTSLKESLGFIYCADRPKEIFFHYSQLHRSDCSKSVTTRS